MSVRLGVDTGGTFCDFVMLDESDGRIRRAKVPSTPSDPARAIRMGLEQLGLGEQASQVTVGTTIATNAVLERRGPKVIYVGNDGFTDIPFIGRLDKERLYDLHWQKPRPLVRRRDCVGVAGRIDHHGNEIEGISDDQLVELESRLESLGEFEDGDLVVAVCLLFSYLRDDHERRVAKIVQHTLPEAHVSLSHEVSPVWREYERASTTIADAFVKPVVADYVRQVGVELEQTIGVRRWNLLASNGGFLDAANASDRPSQLLLSGLAGGVSGARHFAEAAGLDSAFTLDMGGTSCDIGLIEDGVEHYSPEFEMAWGVPATIPCVSVKTIGAGGGSIVWVDKGGMMHVGPRSAGAEPGPVAYGQGGVEPTLTDANLTLGRLAAGSFLGGAMELDAGSAFRAFEEIGVALRLEAHQAALAAIRIADENMANAIRLVAAESGLDPRDFALIAFGGAGPLHARAVAARLGIDQILVPPAPGLCSAFGALISEARVDRVRTYYARSETLDPVELFQALARLCDAAIEDLRRSVDVEDPLLDCFASMRYAGQNFELEVAIPEGAAGSWPQLLSSFEREHLRQYGFMLSGEPVELVHLRARARRAPAPIASRPDAQRPGPSCSREVWFDRSGPLDCPIYQRSELAAGSRLSGPLVIEEFDSTTVALAGDEVAVDAAGALLLTLDAS